MAGTQKTTRLKTYKGFICVKYTYTSGAGRKPVNLRRVDYHAYEPRGGVKLWAKSLKELHHKIDRIPEPKKRSDRRGGRIW